MTSTKISRRSTWQRSMLVAAIATPIAVVLATGSAVSAKKIIVTPADVLVKCQNSETADAPFLEVTAPVLGNEPAEPNTNAGGPQVQVLVFQGSVGGAYADGTLTSDPFYVSPEKISDGESIEIEIPQGLFTVIFDMPKYFKDNGNNDNGDGNDWKLDVAESVMVTCGGGGGGGGGYNFNFSIPKVTTPPLPKTGGDSNSMLILAPVMVLMGGALILVRRRLATA